jgi:hypothetical protein
MRCLCQRILNPWQPHVKERGRQVSQELLSDTAGMASRARRKATLQAERECDMVCVITWVMVCHLEGRTLLQAKLLVLLMLAAAGAASLAVMLLVSVDTGFLPGMVELSVGLAAATAMSVVWLASSGRRAALSDWADQVGWPQVRLGAAGVTILVASAGLATSFDRFPWPVGLLAAVLVLFAATGPGARQASGGQGGRRRPDFDPAAPKPSPSSVPKLLRRRAVQLNAMAPAHAWARCDVAGRPALRCRRKAQKLHPMRRVPAKAALALRR